MFFLFTLSLLLMAAFFKLGAFTVLTAALKVLLAVAVVAVAALTATILWLRRDRQRSMP